MLSLLQLEKLPPAELLDMIADHEFASPEDGDMVKALCSQYKELAADFNSLIRNHAQAIEVLREIETINKGEGHGDR